MARMGYVHTLVLRRSSGFFGNRGGGYFSDTTFFATL